MPIKVHLPDGRIVNFPDTMATEDIQREVGKLSAPTGDAYTGPDTFLGGAIESLGTTASGVAKGVGRSLVSAVDPRNLYASAKMASRVMTDPMGLGNDLRAAGPGLWSQAKNVASGDPEAGGEAIGTLATGLLGPKMLTNSASMLERGGGRLMQAALKPTQALVNARRGAGFGSKAAIAHAVLDEGRSVTGGGLRKAQEALDLTDATAHARLASGAGRGVTVDALQVAQAIEDTAGPSGVFGQQINAGPDIAAIRGVSDSFLSNPHVPPSGQMPADLAHTFASNTGRNLKGKFGRLGGATVEAEKVGREAITSKLRQQIPALDDLWRTEARQMTTRDAIDAALGRQGNRDPISFPTIVGMLKNPALAAGAAANSSGAIKSLMARALHNGAAPALRTLDPAVVRAALLQLMTSHANTAQPSVKR